MLNSTNAKILLRGGLALTLIGFLVFVGDKIPFRIALEDYTASALAFFGATPLDHGLVGMAGNYFYVGWDCSSAFVGLLYATVLLLSPLRLMIRAAGALLGFPIIFLVNLVRVAVIILAYSDIGAGSFFWSHIVVGPLMLGALVVGLWFLFAARS